MASLTQHCWIVSEGESDRGGEQKARRAVLHWRRLTLDASRVTEVMWWMPETTLLTQTAAAVAVRELTLGEAVREALAEEMRRDPRVFIMGEDVAEAGTTFKVLTGLVQEFGPDRVLDTPISETGVRRASAWVRR